MEHLVTRAIHNAKLIFGWGFAPPYSPVKARVVHLSDENEP